MVSIGKLDPSRIPVPTTEIRTDTTIEERKIADRISELKSKRDRAEIDTREAVIAADEALERLKMTRDEIELLRKAIDDGSCETLAFIADCQKMMDSSGTVVKEMVVMAKALMMLAENAAQELEETRRTSQAIHDQRVKEGEILERQREDLDIYHSRLKAYFEQYLPGQKIVI